MTALYWLRTEQEHGRTDARLRLAASAFTGLSLADARLGVSRQNGKPFFPSAPELFCSVTHSGGVWLCALSSAPVGTDLQERQNRDILKIAAHFFRPDETAWLRENPDRFFDVWCAKESYVKFTGDGLIPGLDSFSVVKDGGLSDSVHGAALRLVPFLPGYALCVCGGDSEIRLGGLPGNDEL